MPDSMNVLVVGSGAREHAILEKLRQNGRGNILFVAPGNAGTASIAQNLDLPLQDPEAIKEAAIANRIDFTIVGPEAPLQAGLVDSFHDSRLPIFGPTRAAARLEWSKGFAKDLMQQHGIPCAHGDSFDNYEAARAYLDRMGAPVVVKADGLAAGKGVTVCHRYEEARQALDDAMLKGVYGQAGNRVVIEECLQGPEVSLLAFSDGTTVVPMVSASDYKRIHDGDLGPNTGGMGCVSPSPYFTPALVAEAHRTILEPTVRAMREAGTPYVGVLYAGLIMTPTGMKVLEFNCRFGDPETQVILPRLKTDLLDIMMACTDGRLDTLNIEWSADACVGVVIASGGYPEAFKTGFLVSGLDRVDNGVHIFHAGTAVAPASVNSDLGGPAGLSMAHVPPPPTGQTPSGSVLTAGGRVLTVAATGLNLEEARQNAYDNVQRIEFKDAYYRQDIGMVRNDQPALPAPWPAPTLPQGHQFPPSLDFTKQEK